MLIQLFLSILVKVAFRIDSLHIGEFAATIHLNFINNFWNNINKYNHMLIDAFLANRNLSRNNITSLPSNTFQYLTHLQVL